MDVFKDLNDLVGVEKYLKIMDNWYNKLKG